MKKLTTLALAIMPATLLFTACDKGSEKGTPDVTAPEISVYEPDPNDTYAVGDTIFLLADVTDDSELQDFTVKLVNGNDTVPIWPFVEVIFGNIKSYHLDAFILDTYNITTDAIMLYEASDKKDNMGKVEVPIHLTN